ncbi:MAG: hypothetical protein K8R90_03985 [Candidatus Cloacimonetes bacterium]|nr:hypothetical protein [Candidatus Cloacimonadota bacterium]
MIQKYNPTSIFIDVMRLKYRMLIPSIALIVVSFVANFYVETPVLRWLSVVALLGYFVVFFAYRLRRLTPPDEPGAILSPVCGKVTAVTEHPTETVIVIRKRMFDPADVRSALAGEVPADTRTVRSIGGDVSWQIAAGRFHLLDDRPGLQGRLMGVFPFGGEARVTLSKDWEVSVVPGQPVSAGETVIGKQDEGETDTA